MKIRPVGAELFHADGQTDMTKLIVAFSQFFERAQKCIAQEMAAYKLHNKERIVAIQRPVQEIETLRNWYSLLNTLYITVRVTRFVIIISEH